MKTGEKSIGKDTKVSYKVFCFKCFGVKIGIRADDPEFLELIRARLSSVLPVKWQKIEEGRRVDHWVSAHTTLDGYTIEKNGEYLLEKGTLSSALEKIEQQIRLTVAEYAKNLVFLHAGAVSWRGKALIIPGKTFTGKTTLVSELIKRNCRYLSDEYAVIDKKGLVHPFPKKLSLRGIIDDYTQVDFDVEELGGRRRKTPVKAGYLLLVEYRKKNTLSAPDIRLETAGEGVMESVANSVSVRQNPKFVLEVLSRVAAGSLVLRATRGEASEFADIFLRYLEESS